jgi:hypothetical protein
MFLFLIPPVDHQRQHHILTEIWSQVEKLPEVGFVNDPVGLAYLPVETINQ